MQNVPDFKKFMSLQDRKKKDFEVIMKPLLQIIFSEKFSVSFAMFFMHLPR